MQEELQEKLTAAVKANAAKAATAASADDALKYTQAVLNIAHALATLHNI